jgi:hypothetical protein
MAKATDDDESLKRLGGGRWQTRDERFTIEPQSGTWVVVDAEQTDELGLPLVRGPFGSLGAAKEGIATARGTEPAASPLAERAAKLADRPAKETPGSAKSRSASGRPAKTTKVTEEPPAEPKWLQALDPDERRRAKRLIERLAEAGAPDPEGLTRRDIVGDVPAVAAFAVTRAIAELGRDASPAKVAALLAGGRDTDLGVRWRLVDGDDRPLTLDAEGGEA